MYYFSSVIQVQDEIQKAQKQGLPSQTYEIETKDMVEDYNKMINWYNANARTASKKQLEGFAEEAKDFYLIAKDLYIDLSDKEDEQSEQMYNIYIGARETYNITQCLIHRKEKESTSER